MPKCRWLHDWSTWGEPFEAKGYEYVGNPLLFPGGVVPRMDILALWQGRKCYRWGELETPAPRLVERAMLGSAVSPDREYHTGAFGSGAAKE